MRFCCIILLPPTKYLCLKDSVIDMSNCLGKLYVHGVIKQYNSNVQVGTPSKQSVLPNLPHLKITLGTS